MRAVVRRLPPGALRPTGAASGATLRRVTGTAGELMHQPAARHMLGMGVGVDRGHQYNAQLSDQGEIAIVLLKHRIDKHHPGGSAHPPGL